MSGLMWRWLGVMLFARVMWAGPLSAELPPPGEWACAYRMRGEVRLLLFWVGRDRVGGGSVSFRRSPGSAAGTWSEEVELVFGSDPGRVPGRVNRWGHARERADWEIVGRQPTLARTVFDGLMRHSESRTPAGVLAGHRSETARGLYEYKALHSEVTRHGALAEIRVFTDPREFHYRTPEPLLSRYREVVASQSPHQRTRLSNSRAHYSSPSGFLSGLRGLIDRVLDMPVGGPRSAAVRPSAIIVHNAALYRLEVKQVAYAASWPGLPEAGEVAGIRFQIVRLEHNNCSEFSIAVPVHGPLRGVPVRIEYQPNWWLRVRLDLERPAPRQRP